MAREWLRSFRRRTAVTRSCNRSNALGTEGGAHISGHTRAVGGGRRPEGKFDRERAARICAALGVPSRRFIPLRYRDRRRAPRTEASSPLRGDDADRPQPGSTGELGSHSVAWRSPLTAPRRLDSQGVRRPPPGLNACWQRPDCTCSDPVSALRRTNARLSVPPHRSSDSGPIGPSRTCVSKR